MAQKEMTGEQLDKLLESAAAESLEGDIRDTFIEWFKTSKLTNLWEDMLERDQRDAVDRCASLAQKVVERAALLIAAGGHENHAAKIVDFKVTQKGELEAKIRLNSNDDALLFCMHNPFITITNTKTMGFTGETKSREAHISPDQADIEELPEQESGEEPPAEEPEQTEAQEQSDQEQAAIPLPEGMNPRYGRDFDAGVHARKTGKPIEICSLKETTKRGKAWRAGWEALNARANRANQEEMADASEPAEEEPEAEPTEADDGLDYEEGEEEYQAAEEEEDFEASDEELAGQAGRPDSDDDEEDDGEVDAV